MNIFRPIFGNSKRVKTTLSETLVPVNSSVVESQIDDAPPIDLFVDHKTGYPESPK